MLAVCTALETERDPFLRVIEMLILAVLIHVGPEVG
jgi:hypothetical protein